MAADAARTGRSAPAREMSQQVNERYLDALASVDDSARLQEILQPIEKRKQWEGRPVRALHPFSREDSALLEIVSRGEFLIRGICNKDLRHALFPQPASTLAASYSPPFSSLVRPASSS